MTWAVEKHPRCHKTDCEGGTRPGVAYLLRLHVRTKRGKYKKDTALEKRVHRRNKHEHDEHVFVRAEDD